MWASAIPRLGTATAGYEVKPDDNFGNVWRAGLFKYQRRWRGLGKPVDRKEWSMTPQTVNAVNLPLQNALSFPAAILQPPFFDPKAPAAANYGAIGSIIGHEISHTFDTEGSAFDSKGRLRNWWTSADLAHFEAATAKLAEQYDTYMPFPDLQSTASRHWRKISPTLPASPQPMMAIALRWAAKPAPEQDGFSGDQQFFIAFARTGDRKHAAQRCASK